MKRLFLTLILGAAPGAGQAQTAHSMPGMTMPAPVATRPTLSPAVKALRLTQGWVAAAPPGAEELSGYLTLSNPGKAALTLTGVSSPISGQAMLMNTSRDSAGRESMRMAASMKIPAGGSLKILPGQAHLMFRALKRQPQPGEMVSVTLSFSDGSARTLRLPVRKW